MAMESSPVQVSPARTSARQTCDVIIRAAIRADMAQVSYLVKELADFEKMTKGPTLRTADLVRDAFDVTPPLFRCKVAEKVTLSSSPPGASVEHVVGYAIFFNTYSTWEGKSLMLEDLYVKPNHRGKGIGAKLFDAVVMEAITTKCKRIDFHVLSWNPAREFYERRGAENLTQSEDWLCYRINSDKLKELELYAATARPR